VLNWGGMGADVNAATGLPAARRPTGHDLVQAHDDRAIFQASPDELRVIDIHSL